MRKCPVCDNELTHVDYEGFRIMQCLVCKGHLLSKDRLKSIKRLDRKSFEQLKSESSGEFKRSSEQKLDCPRCHMTMSKRPLDPPSQALHADMCEACSLVWLDGGELAIAQLSFQTSNEFRTAQDMRQRVRELEKSPERKAEFEANLAALPEHGEQFSNEPAHRGVFGRPSRGHLFSSLLRAILRLLSR